MQVRPSHLFSEQSFYMERDAQTTHEIEKVQKTCEEHHVLPQHHAKSDFDQNMEELCAADTPEQCVSISSQVRQQGTSRAVVLL